MKKLFVPAMAALALALTGCASKPAQIDPTPLPLNSTDSVAMQTLKSGFVNVPFDIDDAVVSSDAYQSKIGYGTSAGLGFLAHGGIGAIGGLGMAAIINAGGDPSSDWLHYIAWVPADNIDINDRAAIDEYLKTNYMKPAADAFIASDFNKNMDHPTEFVSYQNGTYKVKGGACWPIMHGKEKYGECTLFYGNVVGVVRYATPESGLPFEPEVKAKRYIVVRYSDANLNTAVMLPYLKSNMVSVYVPAMGYKAEHLNRFAPQDKPIVSKDAPFVLNNGDMNFFIKVKK